ncbi:MAG TPA: hypothetical protein VGK58_15675 [Lacipirellulaceae bacterium]
MHCSVRYRSFADALILLLSFVLLQTASEMRAFASCGDWLVHSGQSHNSAQQAMSDANSDASNANWIDDATASNQDSIPLPCNGPFCRSVPTKPVPTAPPSTVNPSDKLLLTAQDILCDPHSRWSFMHSAVAAHSLRGFPVDIEHPPRA